MHGQVDVREGVVAPRDCGADSARGVNRDQDTLQPGRLLACDDGTVEPAPGDGRTRCIELARDEPPFGGAAVAEGGDARRACDFRQRRRRLRRGGLGTELVRAQAPGRRAQAHPPLHRELAGQQLDVAAVAARPRRTRRPRPRARRRESRARCGRRTFPPAAPSARSLLRRAPTAARRAAARRSTAPRSNPSRDTGSRRRARRTAPSSLRRLTRHRDALGRVGRTGRMTRMRFIPLAALAVCAAAAVPAALADGLPVLGIDVGTQGVASDSAPVRYVTVPAAGRTIVARTATRGGRVLRHVSIAGNFTIPAVAYDGSASGLSADGQPPRPDPAAARVSARPHHLRGPRRAATEAAARGSSSVATSASTRSRRRDGRCS